MNKEESILQKHLIDLSKQAYHRDIVVFSDFLNLNELNILHTTPKQMLSSRYETFGGYALSERQMVAFLPDALCYEYAYPIRALEITPAHEKFAEPLTHRDYLGALMHLGFKRSQTGDILTIGPSAAVVFVKDTLAPFIEEQLTSVRHTDVRVRERDPGEIEWQPKLSAIKGTVPSVRLDTVLAVAWPLSRSKLTAYIAAGKVFVNGKLITSNGYRLNEGDVISLRGVGRIRYNGILSETKKGRFFVSVDKFE